MKNKKINNLIFNIKGQVCWRAWDGLLPAIFFELGDKQDKKKVQYSISLDTCPWQIFENNKEIANSKSDVIEVKKVLDLFVGKKVIDIVADQDRNSQKIVFENGLVINTYLNEDSDEWYILFPKGTLSFSKKEITFKKK